MANSMTSVDLKKGALIRAGETADGLSQFDQRVMVFLNDTYQAVLSGGSEFGIDVGDPWVWAKAQHPGVIELKPSHTAGTVSLTKGSTSGTFSSAPAASMKGRLLKLDERPEFFRIDAHTAAATAFTLDANYTDTTNTALSYKAHLLDYDLTAGIMRLFSPMVVYRNQSIDVINGVKDLRIMGTTLSSLQRDYPLVALQIGSPTLFAQKYETDGLITVRMNRSPDTEMRVEYDYIPSPADLEDADTSIPVIPREYRKILEYGAAYFILLDKEDNKAQVYLNLVQAKLKAMVEENRKEMTVTSTNFGKIYPRQDVVGRSVLTSGDC